MKLKPEKNWLCTVVCITAMINHVFISFSAVQIDDLSYIHLYSSSSTDILRTHKVASSQWLDSSVGRALRRYRRGHKFESHSGLNLFQALITQLLTVVCIAAMINHVFCSFELNTLRSVYIRYVVSKHLHTLSGA